MGAGCNTIETASRERDFASPLRADCGSKSDALIPQPCRSGRVVLSAQARSLNPHAFCASLENSRALRRSVDFEQLLLQSWSKERLRNAFVARALTYIGVPYSRKYFPETPARTLFLDCCGLVRRVVRDLQAHFGFPIERWNQSYQLDTLPVVLDRNRLVPGDLIFWIGHHRKNKKKAKRLNCVHVEIYLGSQRECLEKLGCDIPELACMSGESADATVGSRIGSRVQVHKTFMATPASKLVINGLCFRSLETWLAGVCRGNSFHWGKRSVASAGGGPAEHPVATHSANVQEVLSTPDSSTSKLVFSTWPP